MKYVILVLVISACFGAAPAPEAKPFTSQITPMNNRGVTLENFHRIRHHMSLECVDKIMGQRGKKFEGWTGTRSYIYSGDRDYIIILVGGAGVIEASFTSPNGRTVELLPIIRNIYILPSDNPANVHPVYTPLLAPLPIPIGNE